MDKGEFELIDDIKRRFSSPCNVLGIGDDCAVIPQKGGLESLISTDMLMEGVHFLMDKISPYQLGWKSAAVNISDIAAMGGNPQASFLSFSLPENLDSEWVNAFIGGYSDLSDRFSCPLLGGDTTSSLDRLCISVTVIGTCKLGASKKRSGAMVGDMVYVGGCLGDSAAGLKCILSGESNRSDVEKILIQRHYLPLPQVEEGKRLSCIPGVHAMMDISDGIGSDLRHILKTSGVSAEIDTMKIPLSNALLAECNLKGWDPIRLALEGGEDYKLLFTASEDSDALVREAFEACGSTCHAIGRIVSLSDTDVFWLASRENYSGYRHF